MWFLYVYQYYCHFLLVLVVCRYPCPLPSLVTLHCTMYIGHESLLRKQSGACHKQLAQMGRKSGARILHIWAHIWGIFGLISGAYLGSYLGHIWAHFLLVSLTETVKQMPEAVTTYGPDIWGRILHTGIIYKVEVLSLYWNALVRKVKIYYLL